MMRASAWIQFCSKPVRWEDGRPCLLLDDHPGVCKARICGAVYEAGSIDVVYVCHRAPGDLHHADGHLDMEKLRGWG